MSNSYDNYKEVEACPYCRSTDFTKATSSYLCKSCIKLFPEPVTLTKSEAFLANSLEKLFELNKKTF